MKLLKMRIKRIKDASGTHYSYPPSYDAKKVIFGPFYEGGSDEGIATINTRNKDDEYIIFGVKDEEAINFLNSHSEIVDNHKFDTIEISRDDAVINASSWVKPFNKLTDPKKVMEILGKIGKNELLTDEEKNILNPDHPTLGLNRSKTFMELLDIELEKKEIDVILDR